MKGLVRALAAGAVAATLYSVPAEAMELVEQGPKAGIGWARLKNGDDSDTVAGVAVGWALTFEVNDWFAFQPEILLNFKGGEQDVGGVTSWEADLGYIECQSLARFTFADTEPKSFAFAGLSLGFNIVNREVEVNALGGTDDFEANLFELGYVFGFGTEFPAGDGVMTVDLRLTGGLTDATDEVTRLGVRFPELRNRGVMFMFGYRF